MHFWAFRLFWSGKRWAKKSIKQILYQETYASRAKPNFFVGFVKTDSFLIYVDTMISQNKASQIDLE